MVFRFEQSLEELRTPPPLPDQSTTTRTGPRSDEPSAQTPVDAEVEVGEEGVVARRTNID